MPRPRRGPTPLTAYRLDPATKRMIAEIAAEHGTSATEVVREAVRHLYRWLRRPAEP